MSTALAVTAAAHSSAGEVFGGLSIAPGANDSQALLQALNQGAVPRVFNCLRGPWAAVYWHAPTRKLWFGRDVLGESLCSALASSSQASSQVQMVGPHSRATQSVELVCRCVFC